MTVDNPKTPETIAKNSHHMDQAYMSYIRQLAKEDKDVVFFNSGPNHAAFVMSNIFQKAKNSIRLFSGSLTGEISKSEAYQDELEDFLNRGGQLSILLQNFSKEKGFNLNDILRFQMFSGNENISVKVTPSQIIDGRTSKPIHFLVADNNMYRLETDTEKFLAEGNFNDRKTSEVFSEYFDKLFFAQSAKRIDLI